jgi:histone-lysine N-methyltransferase EZH2
MGYIVDSQYELYTPPLNPKEPQLTTADFFEQPGDACGGECFRGIDSDDMVWAQAYKNYGPNVISWQEVDVFIDLKFLDSMLKLDPDLLPCDLAVICKLPCEQVCQPVGPSPIYPHFTC